MDLFDKLDSITQSILIQIFDLVEDDISLKYAKNIGDFPTSKMGRGNPNYKCDSCGYTLPEISIYGHHKDCSWIENYNRYQFLLSQLPKEVSDNLNTYLEELL